MWHCGFQNGNEFSSIPCTRKAHFFKTVNSHCILYQTLSANHWEFNFKSDKVQHKSIAPHMAQSYIVHCPFNIWPTEWVQVHYENKQLTSVVLEIRERCKEALPKYNALFMQVLLVTQIGINLSHNEMLSDILKRKSWKWVQHNQYQTGVVAYTTLMVCSELYAVTLISQLKVTIKYVQFACLSDVSFVCIR